MVSPTQIRAERLFPEYKKKIEERTGVDLGDVFLGSHIEASLEESKSMVLDKKPVKGLLNLVGNVFFVGGGYRPYITPDKTVITLNYHWMDTMVENNRLGLDRRLVPDHPIVHELSHRLWDKLFRREGENPFTRIGGLGRSKIGIRYFMNFEEGFAAYCANKYFCDFYPEPFNRPQRPSILSLGGYSFYRRIARNFGEDAILDVPREMGKSSEGYAGKCRRYTFFMNDAGCLELEIQNL